MGILVADEEGNTCALEVTLDQPLSTLKALIEADLKVPSAEQVLLKDGQPVRDETSAAIGTLNIKDGDMLYVVRDRARASGQGGPGAKYRSLADLDLAHPEVYIKELQEHPRLLKELEFHDPELAAAVKEQDVVKCRTVQMKRRLQSTKARMDKQKEMAALEANPFDVEAQRKIEEMLRLENVQKNMEVAMEEMPESFGRVIMLYVDAEVNGVPIKAFVDSGAQSTIMSVACAERCGLMRLVDTRFAGVAQGVGTCKILGRVHIAQLKVGRSFYPCTFTVLEKNDMDFLFGLDMLKRHQCVIDLKRGVLQLGTAGESVPFLGEADLPNAARGTYEGEEATPMDDSKPPATGAQPSGANQGGQDSVAGTPAPDLAQLIDMGFPADQAAIALQNAGGNVGLAAQILSEQFGS